MLFIPKTYIYREFHLTRDLITITYEVTTTYKFGFTYSNKSFGKDRGQIYNIAYLQAEQYKSIQRLFGDIQRDRQTFEDESSAKINITVSTIILVLFKAIKPYYYF